MKLKVVEDAFRECRKHLADTQSYGSETEIRLTAFLLVLISANFEVRVEDIIAAYAERLDDRRLRSFLTGAARKQLRAPDIRSIAGFLSLFDAKWGEVFRDNAGDQAISAYDSIISNRHAFVHYATCNTTINDIEGYYHSSISIFSAMIRVFGLRANEISHLH